MCYFVTEAERKASASSCYFEFQKGKYHGKCWKSDSLCLRDTTFDALNLSEIFGAATRFAYFGITEVTQAQWRAILETAHAVGGECEAAVSELSAWAEENFRTHDVFTICGI